MSQNPSPRRPTFAQQRALLAKMSGPKMGSGRPGSAARTDASSSRRAACGETKRNAPEAAEEAVTEHFRSLYEQAKALAEQPKLSTSRPPWRPNSRPSSTVGISNMDGVFARVAIVGEDEMLRQRKIERIRLTRAMQIAKGRLRREQILNRKPHLADAVRDELYSPRTGRRNIIEGGCSKIPPAKKAVVLPTPSTVSRVPSSISAQHQQPYDDDDINVCSRSSSCASSVEFFSTKFRPAKVIEEFTRLTPRRASDPVVVAPKEHQHLIPTTTVTLRPTTTTIASTPHQYMRPETPFQDPIQQRTRSPTPIGATASGDVHPLSGTGSSSRPTSAHILRPGSAVERVVHERKLIKQSEAAVQAEIDRKQRFLELFSKRDGFNPVTGETAPTLKSFQISPRRPQSAKERAKPDLEQLLPNRSAAAGDAVAAVPTPPATSANKPKRPMTATSGRPPVSFTPRGSTAQDRPGSAMSDMVPLSERAFSRPNSASVSRPLSSVAMHLRAHGQRMRAVSTTSSIAAPSTIAGAAPYLTLDVNVSHQAVSKQAPASSYLQYQLSSTTSEHFVANSPRRASFVNHHRNPRDHAAVPSRTTDGTSPQVTPSHTPARKNLTPPANAERAELMAAFGQNFEVIPIRPSRPQTAATRVVRMANTTTPSTSRDHFPRTMSTNKRGVGDKETTGSSNRRDHPNNFRGDGIMEGSSPISTPQTDAGNWGEAPSLFDD